VWAGYALADLDDAMFDRTRWLVDEETGALLLVFLWGDPPGAGATAMAFGPGDPLPDLLRAASLPAQFDLHVPLAAAGALEGLVRGPLPVYVRLGVRRGGLAPAPAVEGLALRPLTPDDVPAARAVYATYPGNVFDPARVVPGPYLGAWAGEALMAVAGTHVRSARLRAAALGDVVVLPAWRRRGVGAWLTGALAARLLEEADLVVLNVERENAAARRAYARVGFGEGVEYVEGAGVSLVG
jgi:GNAT superfamily N-acetyltransferase